MKAEIIAVDTEKLTGQIVNTNEQFLSQTLATLGIDVYFKTAVDANEERLLSVLTVAKKRSDVVILTSGLGPTDDDLTKQILAKFLGKELITDSLAYQQMQKLVKERGLSDFPSNNNRQTLLIEGMTPFLNSIGLAVGGALSVDGVTYIILPGLPHELEVMTHHDLLPYLTDLSTTCVYSRFLHFVELDEGYLVSEIDELMKGQTDLTITPYAKTGEVTLRLSTQATDSQLAQRRLDDLTRHLLDFPLLEQAFYGEGLDISLAQVVITLLKETHQTITAAESLTGGLFQSSLVTIEGASSVFQGGFVTYSLLEKARMLGIAIKDLETYGVVSEFTAKAMASHARLKTQSDIGVALTGVAGPASLENHPVGTVYIGLATATGVASYRLNLGEKSREDIRQLSVLHALNLVRQTLLSSKDLV